MYVGCCSEDGVRENNKKNGWDTEAAPVNKASVPWHEVEDRPSELQE